MRESRLYGSARGAPSNGRPYRDRRDFITVLNNPIVRIPRELIAPASHLPIERRQKNVAQQRRGYPALRRPSFRREEPTLSVTARQ